MPKALRNTTTLFTSLLLAVFLAACGGKDSHDQIAQDTIALMNDVGAALEGVSDKASAEAAAKKLEALVPKFEAIAARVKAIGEPDEATEKALEEKYEVQLTEAMGKMMGPMMALAMNPEAMEVIQVEMEKIGKVMEEVK